MVMWSFTDKSSLYKQLHCLEASPIKSEAAECTRNKQSCQYCDLNMRVLCLVSTAYHTGCEQRAPVVGVEDADQGQRKDADGHGEDLGPRAHAGAEEGEVRREAEHVPVDVLPARLLLIVRCSQFCRVSCLQLVSLLHLRPGSLVLKKSLSVQSLAARAQSGNRNKREG